MGESPEMWAKMAVEWKKVIVCGRKCRKWRKKPQTGRRNGPNALGGREWGKLGENPAMWAKMTVEWKKVIILGGK